jgi:hypothetical protein
MGLAPTRLFLRFWALPTIVPLILLALALRQRIADYGLTPQRYDLGLFGVALAIIVLAQIAPRLRGDMRVVPAVGAVCLFLASFGPWGVITASAASQMQRLMAHLEAADAIEEGRLVAEPQFSRASAEAIRSILSELNSLGQTERLRPILAERGEEALGGDGSRADRLGPLWAAMHVAQLPPAQADWFSFNAEATAAVPIEGYDLALAGLDFSRVNGIESLDLTIRVATDGLALQQGTTQVLIPNERLRAEIEARLDASEANDNAGQLPLMIEADVGSRRIGILIQHAEGKLTETTLVLSTGRYQLFLRRADWAE